MASPVYSPLAFIGDPDYFTRMTTEEALDYFGTQAELARAVGAKRSAINEWFMAGEIPEVRQYQIQIITRGRLKADLPADRRALKS